MTQAEALLVTSFLSFLYVLFEFPGSKIDCNFFKASVDVLYTSDEISTSFRSLFDGIPCDFHTRDGGNVKSGNNCDQTVEIVQFQKALSRSEKECRCGISAKFRGNLTSPILTNFSMTLARSVVFGWLRIKLATPEKFQRKFQWFAECQVDIYDISWLTERYLIGSGDEIKNMWWFVFQFVIIPSLIQQLRSLWNFSENSIVHYEFSEKFRGKFTLICLKTSNSNMVRLLAMSSSFALKNKSKLCKSWSASCEISVKFRPNNRESTNIS